MGNSPRIFELWRQNAKADHVRHTVPDVTATLYVGLNHPDGDGDWFLQDVGNVVSARHDGFTMVNGAGYWRGKSERCAIVVISAQHAAILATVEDLKRILSQECVGITYAPQMQFV